MIRSEIPYHKNQLSNSNLFNQFEKSTADQKKKKKRKINKQIIDKRCYRKDPSKKGK